MQPLLPNLNLCRHQYKMNTIKVLPTKFLTNQIFKVKGQVVTHVDGFDHYHFNTTHYNLRTVKQKVVDLGNHKVTVMKPKKVVKTNVELTLGEFEMLIKEFVMKDQPQEKVEVVLKKTKIQIQRSRKELEKILDHLFDYRTFQAWQPPMTVEQMMTYSETLALKRNKLMHALNGNTALIRHYDIEGQARTLIVEFDESQVNDLYNFEIDEDKNIVFTLFTYYKDQARVRLETDGIMNANIDGTQRSINKIKKMLEPDRHCVSLPKEKITLQVVGNKTTVETRGLCNYDESN